MKENNTKSNLSEDMLKFIIKLYEHQEKIKITYTIKKINNKKYLIRNILSK